MHRFDEDWRSGRFAERLANLADTRLEHGVSDVHVGPHSSQQLVLADQAAGPRREVRQDGKRFRGERHRSLALEQSLIVGIQEERTEAEDGRGSHLSSRRHSSPTVRAKTRARFTRFLQKPYAPAPSQALALSSQGRKAR